MGEQRILTEADMARILRVDVSTVQGLYSRGELPGFEIAPGALRCTEPAFFDWAERRSRPAPDDVDVDEDPGERAERTYTANGHFTALAAPRGPLREIVGKVLSTPDRRRSRPFRLDAVVLDPPGLQITPLADGRRNGASDPVWIRADAVDRCLHYLEHVATPGQATPIQASQNHPGPLARFSRRGNGGVRCLHYLLPILQRCGRVEIDGDSRPNTVRLAPVLLGGGDGARRDAAQENDDA